MPDQPTPVSFRLQDIAHTFRTGHTIMIQVQSTGFPLVDRNPQTFVEIGTAKEPTSGKRPSGSIAPGKCPSHLELIELPR